MRRDPKRIERILKLIKGIWITNSDLRLTQLIVNVLQINQDPYHIEDEVLEKLLKEHYYRKEE